MKYRHLSILLFLVLFVHHSSEQGIAYSGSSNGGSGTDNVDPTVNTGLAGTIRNTTNGILQRLEGPRDRVLEFIKPAVKSDFSRNVTNVLNSIWNRVHQTNSSIIRNPLFRNTIVIPINTTLARLREITRADDEHSELDESNLQVVNLNRPEEEAQFREYLQADSNRDQAISNPTVIFLVRDDDKESNASESNISSSASTEDIVTEIPPSTAEQPISTDSDEVQDGNLNNSDDINNQPADHVDENRASPLPAAVDTQSDPELNPTKSIKRRSARFLDRNQYLVVTPTRVRNLLDNVRRHNMQECMALALCEANCRPHRYEDTRHSYFKNLFDRYQSYNSNHDDYDYYSRARGYGQQYNGNEEDCERCHSLYNCEHDREELIDRFQRMDRRQYD